jgi:hypothetical protein
MSASDEKVPQSSVTNRLFEFIEKMSDEEQRNLLNTLEEGQREDKRRYERKAYFTSIDYITEDRINSGLIQDISIGGLLLEPAEIGESFSIGQELLLTIPHPNKEKATKIRGEVVRIEPRRIGVKFKRKP